MVGAGDATAVQHVPDIPVRWWVQAMPLQCSVFLTRHPGILQSTNASGAAYLFQPDKLHAEFDLGDKTIQCGRRPDAYKLWLAWKV